MTFYTSKAPSTDAITLVKSGPGPGYLICFKEGSTNFTGRVTLVKISSLSIKVMLEPVYTGKAFPVKAGPHLSRHFLCTFKAIFFPQLLVGKHVVSALELPIRPFKWVIPKEKARMLLWSRREMRNLNKQDSSASLLTWLKQPWKNISPPWKKRWLERELCSECSQIHQTALQLLFITVN